MRTIAISVAEALMDPESALVEQYVERSLAYPWVEGGARLETPEAHGFIEHNLPEFVPRAAVAWCLPSWKLPTEDDVYFGLGAGSAAVGSYLEISTIEQRVRAGLDPAELNFVALAVSHRVEGASVLLAAAARVIALHPSACASFHFPETALYTSHGGWIVD